MIIERQALPDIREQVGDQTIAVRFGCFDLLHAGHLQGIDYAAEQADILVIGVSSDERVRQRKGPERPVQRQEVRLANVDEVEGVDFSFVVPFQALAVPRAIAALRPDYFVESTEYSRRRHGAGWLLDKLGVAYVADPNPSIQSTSNLITWLRLADETAA
ncbi:MAG TPA: adenylyltransferase/cytidyltransferase family protein [Candidatus Saccharimonadales bacterium]|nr:adenylyltransferase/cytidyltransferase family protein [Candidatus Saccharimonadales bacterium]